jgi:hypothetical protein
VFAEATATDACASPITLTSNDVTTPGDCPAEYSVTRTWTATDACGNVSTASQTINVQDITAPIITCPAPIVVTIVLGECTANVTLVNPTATDNCSSSFTFNGTRSDALPLTDPYPLGVTTITWTATDACGNTSLSCEQIVTVNDVPPTVAVSDETEIEGTDLVFDISLNHAGCNSITFTPSLTSGTAIIGTDTGTPVQYSTNGGTTWSDWSGGNITIPAGNTSMLFKVPSVNVILDEVSENFTLTATIASGNTANVSSTGTGTILDNDTEISGNVFNDLNRLTDLTVNGTGTNAGGLYANLVNPATNQVIASVPVNADGTYAFNSNTYNVFVNTSYKIILTSSLQTVGSLLSAATLPNTWISTGENVGAGPGHDGIIDSKLIVTTTTTGVTQANFGIVQVPDLTPIITATPNVMHGITNFNIFVRLNELNNVSTNGLITVKIPKDSRWIFDGAFDPNLTILGSTPLNNSVWSYSSDATNHIFTTSSVIAANSFSTIGFKAKWDAGFTKGIYTLTSQILGGSGGENRINNNVDAEKIDYFIY